MSNRTALSGAYISKRILLWLVIIWTMLLIHRVIFIVVYLSESDPGQGWLIVGQFLYGMRFDLATTVLLVLPIALIWPFAFFENFDLKIIKFFEYIQFLWLGLMNMLLAASTYNYNVNNKHLGWEFSAYLSDTQKILSGLWSDSPFLFIVFVSILPVWMVGGHLVFLKGANNKPIEKNPSIKTRWQQFRTWSVFYIMILAVFIISFRGGISSSPLRTADAMRTQSSYLNNVALNGVFSVAYSFKGSREYEEYYDKAENVRFVQNLIDKPEAFISAEYPLLRYMPRKNKFGSHKRPNIVLIILESFTAKYLKIHGGDPGIAPNLNQLIQNGMYFDRFMASGGRSANGLFCMFAGLPDRAGPTILRSAYINNHFGGIARLIRKNGYTSSFVHGGDLNFDNLNTVLPHLGFDALVGFKELKQDTAYTKETPWGFDDFDSFHKFMAVIDKSKQPFFSTVFSVNTHHPYIQSSAPEKLFTPDSPQNRYLNSYHYSDAILGDFMKKARTKAWFDNTVFIILADHAHHRGLNYLEDRHIPLLIYAPRFIKPKINSRLASQLDILPTILAIAGGDSPYSALGNDLLDDSKKDHFVFYAGGSGTNLIGWIENEYLLVHSIDIKQQFLLKGTFPALQKDLSSEHPQITQDYLRKAQHVQQFARSLEKNNNAFPPN